MKVNIRSKTIEIKKKHVYRAVFCGAIVTAVVYRKKYHALNEEFGALKDYSDGFKVFADGVVTHALASGIATIEERPGNNFGLKFDYNPK